MSFWNKMKDFFDKYGGRNGVNSAKNYNENSYGNLTSTPSGVQYGTYQYHDLNASLKRRASQGRGKDSTRSYRDYDVTGNTYDDFLNYGSNRGGGREFYRDREKTMGEFMDKRYRDNRNNMPQQSRERGGTESAFTGTPHYVQNRERGTTGTQLKGTTPYGNGKLQTARGNLVYDANYNAADNTFRGTNSNFGEGHYSTPSGNVIFHANYEAADRNFDHKPHALKKDKSLYQTPFYGNLVYNANYKNGDTKYEQKRQDRPSELDPRKVKFWETPEYGNKVYFANYDFVDAEMDPKRMLDPKSKETQKREVILESANKYDSSGNGTGIGRTYTNHIYPWAKYAPKDITSTPDEKLPYYQRKSGPAGSDSEMNSRPEDVRKEWEKIHKAQKGPGFVNYDIDMILEANGITPDRIKNKILNARRININRSPSFSEIINFGKQYIFFSKPDLNIFSDNSGTINPSIKQNLPDLYMKIIRNPIVAQSLQSSFGGPNRGHGGGIITQLTNLCNECQWQQMGLSKKDGPKNMKGQGMSYGGDFFEASDQTEMDISFLDNRDRDIEIMMEIWTEYIEGVNNGAITKKALYIANNTVDYAINIWVLTLDESYNVISWGMAGACYPLTVNTDILNYSAIPKTASELTGPFSYKFHVSYFHKPNMHRTIEMLNYSTGFGKTISPHLSNTKASYQYMQTQVGNYWIHSGFIPYHTTLFEGYEFHFNIEDKYAEMVGVHISYPSSGDVQYSLAFASRDVGPARKPGDFGTNEYSFYRYDEEIQKNYDNWEKWAEQHPDYYRNLQNKSFTGIPLWNQERFNPDYQAWLISHKGKTWNERFNRGYDSSSNRYGAFTGSGSNSGFFSGAAGKVLNAFKKWF